MGEKEFYGHEKTAAGKNAGEKRGNSKSGNSRSINGKLSGGRSLEKSSGNRMNAAKPAGKKKGIRNVHKKKGS